MKLLQRLASLPIRLRLALGIFVCALVFVMVIIFAIGQFNQAVPSSTSTILTQYAKERANLLNLAIQKGRSLTLQISNDPRNLQNFAALNAIPENATVKRSIQTSFQQILNIEPSIQQIRFVSSSGKTLLSLPTEPEDTNETDESYFRIFTGNISAYTNNSVYINEISTETSPSISYAAIPFASNNPSGFIVVTIDISGSADPNDLSVFRAMQNVDTPLGTVDFYLLGIDNRLIHTEKQVASVSPQAVTESQLFAHTGGEPHEYTSLLTDKAAVGISQKLVIPQFVLVAELPATQITAATDLSRFAWPILAISVIGLLMMLVVGFVLELTVARPVQTTLNLAVGLVQGHPSTVTNVFNQSDELVQLQDALIQLGEQVRHDNVTLEKRINARIQSMNGARSVTRALLTVRSVNSLYTEIATLIQQHFSDVENVQFFGVDPNNTAAIILYTTDKIYGRTRSANQWPITMQNLIGRVVTSKSASILLETDAADTGDTLMPNMRAELGIPLTDNNVIVGILDLQSSSLTAFSQAETSIFTDIAEMIVTALKNVRQFEQLQTKLTETEAMNEQLVGETWRKYVATRPATPITGNKNANEEWSDTQRRALQSNALAESVGPDTVTFAVPVSLRNQVLGAVEWEVPRTVYNESTRQLARELATRLAISADNARLFEQSQWTAQRERLVNDISSKLTQQTDVAEILKIAVREVGQALRLPQTSIRLATNEETQQG